MNNLKKLNIGAVIDIRKEWFNLNKVTFKGVNVVHNLNDFPYPFKDNEIDEIFCRHVLYAVDDWHKVIKELHRISKPNAIWEIHVPFYNSRMAHTYTAKHFFDLDSFDIFSDEIGKNEYMRKVKSIEPILYHILKIELNPTLIGKFIPKRFRYFIGLVLGEVINEIHFKLKVIKNN